MADVPGDTASLDKALRRHNCPPLLGARYRVHPARVLFNDNPTVGATEPTQRLRREPGPSDPLGQNLPTADTAAWSDDLHTFGGEILDLCHHPG